MKVKFNQIKTMERESGSVLSAEQITTLLNEEERDTQEYLLSKIPPALLSTLRDGLITTDMAQEIAPRHRGEFFHELNPRPDDFTLCQVREPLSNIEDMTVKPDNIQAIALGGWNFDDNRQLLVIIQERGTLVWQYDTKGRSWSIAGDVNAIGFKRQSTASETDKVSYSLGYTTPAGQTGFVSVAHLAFKEPPQSVKQLLVEKTELDNVLTVGQTWLEDILNGKSESSVYKAELNLLLAISQHLLETTGSESDRLPALGEGSLGFAIPDANVIPAFNELNLGDIYAITFGNILATEIVQIYTRHGIITYTRPRLQGKAPENWSLLSRSNAAWRFGYKSKNPFFGKKAIVADQDNLLRNPKFLLNNSAVFDPFAVLYEGDEAVENYSITEIYGVDPKMLQDIYSEAREVQERMKEVIATLNNRGEESEPVSSAYDHLNDIQRLIDQGIIETVGAVDLEDYHDLEKLPNTEVTVRLSHIDKIVLAKNSTGQTYLLLTGPNGITVLECEDTKITGSSNLINRTWKLTEPILVEFGYDKAPYCIIQPTDDKMSRQDYNVAGVYITKTRVKDQEK